MDGRNRADIKVSARVRVVRKPDQRFGRLTEGIVRDILTKSLQHPHGIKVRLEGGIVGRVKGIVSDERNSMRIYIDADAFPNVIKDVVIRASVRLNVPLCFVANKPVKVAGPATVSFIQVPEGRDVADERIAELVEPGDLVITADIPLADRVVSKGAFALDPRGKLYTQENVKNSLALRGLFKELRDEGMMSSGPAAFSKQDRQAFANRLDRFLTGQLKREKEKA